MGLGERRKGKKEAFFLQWKKVFKKRHNISCPHRLKYFSVWIWEEGGCWELFVTQSLITFNVLWETTKGFFVRHGGNSNLQRLRFSVSWINGWRYQVFFSFHTRVLRIASPWAKWWSESKYDIILTCLVTGDTGNWYIFMVLTSHDRSKSKYVTLTEYTVCGAAHFAWIN